MGTRIGTTVITLGLCSSALVASLSPLEITHESEAAMSHGTPEYRAVHPMSPDKVRGLGSFLILSPDISSTSTTLNEPTPSLPLVESTPVSSEQKRKATQATEYVARVLKPVARQKGFVIIDPINTHNDPVNLSGQFIVTTPRAEKSRKTCAMQFTVATGEEKRAPNNIQVAVYGNVKLLGDGERYGSSSYNGDLGHNEGAMVFGKDFKPEKPTVATEYMHQTFTKFCRVPAE